MPAGLRHLYLLKDINFDGNSLFEPLQDVCKGKQLHPILCYLESADERDGMLRTNTDIFRALKVAMVAAVETPLFSEGNVIISSISVPR